MAPAPRPASRHLLSSRARARAASSILPRSAAIVTGLAALYFLAMAAVALL